VYNYHGKNWYTHHSIVKSDSNLFYDITIKFDRSFNCPEYSSEPSIGYLMGIPEANYLNYVFDSYIWKCRLPNYYDYDAYPTIILTR
jgi:hypothetical protein